MKEAASFGPYRVVRKLGQGGMGAVYLGEHTLIGRRAAIKVLHPARSAQRESVERFFNEARATSAVEDPGIVHIYDFGVTDAGTAYLVMEFLDGESLSARLRRLGVLPSAEAVKVTRQIAGSLAAAHAAGIVHRDLKPENLFMIRDNEAVGGERPKILDFGIAKLGDGNERMERFRTHTGVVMGTPAYMSPEQCNDTGKIDQRTDIYSLGCVLFHLLTGRPPFDVVGVGATIAAHLREPAPAPSSLSPRVPAILDDLVARCLAKRPDDRFATMIELQQACDALIGHLPASTQSAAEIAIRPATRADNVTTLGSSAGETSAGERRTAQLRVWLAAGAGAIVAGVLLAVATAPRADIDPAAPAAPAAHATSPAPAPSAAPPPVTITPLPAPAKPQPPPQVTPPPAATAPAPAPKKPAAKKHKPVPSPSDEDFYEERI